MRLRIMTLACKLLVVRTSMSCTLSYQIACPPCEVWPLIYDSIAWIYLSHRMALLTGVPLRGRQTYKILTLEQLTPFPNTTMFWFTISGTKSLLALTKLPLHHSSRLRPVIPRHICQFSSHILLITIILTFSCSIQEIPSRCLPSLATPPLMVMPHGSYRWQATSLVIPLVVTLEMMPSISSVSTISACSLHN